MSQYTSNIGGYVDPQDLVSTTTGTGTTAKNSNWILAALGILGTVLGAVIPQRNNTYQTPNPYPTPQPQQGAGISTNTLLLGAVALFLFMRK